MSESRLKSRSAASKVVWSGHSCPHLADFEAYINERRSFHNVTGELKWKEISNRFSDINFILDCLDIVLTYDSVDFDVIVVDAKQYKNWSQHGADREKAFYITYTQLLTHSVRRHGDPTQILIDQREDSYPKAHEAVEVIGNRMLAKLACAGKLDSVTKVVSHDVIGIQVADALTGAVVAASSRFLDPNFTMHKGKQIAITRMAELLGWDDLLYDTYPDSKFNIWHFPPEYRAKPATRFVQRRLPVPYLSRGDL